MRQERFQEALFDGALFEIGNKGVEPMLQAPLVIESDADPHKDLGGQRDSKNVAEVYLRICYRNLGVDRNSHNLE